MARAEWSAANRRHSRQEIEAAAICRAGSRAAPMCPSRKIVAGTKSSNVGGGDVGSVFSVHATIPLFDRARPGTGAGARARWRRPRRSVEAFPCGAARRSRRCATVVLERREAADRYRADGDRERGRLERIAQVSYDAGERGILELLDAYRSGGVRATAAGARSTRRRGRRRSSWNSSADGRSGDEPCDCDDACWPRCCWRRLQPGCGRRSTGRPPRRPTLDVTSWTEQDRAVHGASAARRRPDGPVRRSPHATRGFQRAQRRPPVDRDDAGARWRRRHASRIRAAAARRVSRRRARCRPPDAIGGRCSSTRPASPIATISGSTTVFADEAAAVADAEKQPEDDPAAIAYLKEQQWTNAFATDHGARGDVRTSIRVPAAIEPVTGGEAIVSAPAAGRYASTPLPSVGDRVAPGRCSGVSSRACRRRRRPRDARRRRVAEAQAGARCRAGRSGACRTAAGRARRAGAAGRRGAARGRGRRRAADGRRGAAGAARRGAAAAAAAPRRATPSSCARRLPAASSRSWPRSAPRTTRARRCSGSSGPTSRAAGAGARRPMRRCRAAMSGAGARRSRPSRSDRSSSPTTCTTPA